MTTVTDANVHNVAVAGTFDDCQASQLARIASSSSPLFDG
jgi:threonine synthase